MPEYTELQNEVLKILEDKKNQETSLFSKKSTLTNSEIYGKMNIKPKDEAYVSDILKSLAKKGKIKYETKYLTGHSGKQRTITIL